MNPWSVICDHHRIGFLHLIWFQFDLINAKKKEKKGYKNSGQIVVKAVKIEQVIAIFNF